MKSALRILLAVIAALLVSCIDGREEYWLEANGSGRAVAEYSLPASVVAMHGGDKGLRELLDGFLKNTPAISASSCDVSTRDGRTYIKASVAFDSALDLREVATGSSIKTLPSAASALAGEIKAGLSGRKLDFIRTVEPAKALPGAAFMPDAQFRNRNLVYIMHLPAVPLESNATRIEDDGRTLVWEVPLSRAIRSPIITRFRMDVPIPWKLIGSVGLPLLLMGSLLIRRIRRARRIHSDAETTTSAEPV